VSDQIPHNEREATARHLRKLAQCHALLRALDAVTAPGTVWDSADDIPVAVLRRALALVVSPRDRQIHPVATDYAAARRDASAFP
jgi:hypothetical protein